MDWVAYALYLSRQQNEIEKNKKEMEKIENEVEKNYPKFYTKYIKIYNENVGLKSKNDNLVCIEVVLWFFLFCSVIALIATYGDLTRANKLCHSFLEHKLERWLR